MLVGICQIEIFIPESGSLKSKRFVLSSLKARLKNKFNISIAEVDENEKWQRTTLGIAVVSNERRFIDKVIAQILNVIETEDQVELVNHQLEII
jgi:uncharacterized protein YlxP (DUF503 family)